MKMSLRRLRKGGAVPVAVLGSLVRRDHRDWDPLPCSSSHTLMPVAVGAPGGDVDFTDQAGEPLAAQLRGVGGSPLLLGAVLACHSQDPAAAIGRDPGVDESIDHRAEPLGGAGPQPGTSLPGGRSPARSRARGCVGGQHAAPLTRYSWSRHLATVDPVLLDPLGQRDRLEVEFVSGLPLRFARTDERDGPGAEPGRVGTGQVFSLPVKAVT